uniref:Uncharacterized protein n=1 Tax=Arundo donax TaxID=35708 RepID=A0A0A9H2W6_ARUDO
MGVLGCNNMKLYIPYLYLYL